VIDNPLGKQGGTAEGAFLGVGKHLQAADHISCGVLDLGQVQSSDLGPEFWDIFEILGIDIDLFKHSPAGFYGSEVMFSFMLFPFPSQQALVVPDLSDSFLRQRQSEVGFDAARAPGGKSLFEFDGPELLFWVNGAVRMMRGFASVHKASQRVFLVASEPLSDGISVDTKAPGSGFNAMVEGTTDHLVTQECGVFTFSHDIVVWDRTHLLGQLLEDFR
jgi:hypothetical protein